MIDARRTAAAAHAGANAFVQLAACCVIEPSAPAKRALAAALPTMAEASRSLGFANFRAGNPRVRARHVDPVRDPAAVQDVAAVVASLRGLAAEVAALAEQCGWLDDGVCRHLVEAAARLAGAQELIGDVAGDPVGRRAGRRAGCDVFGSGLAYEDVRHEYGPFLAGAHVLELDETTFVELADQARVQRDELDAIETFARVLAAVPLSADDTVLLAGVANDEARHSEIGERLLRMLGIDPGALRVSVTGVELRAGLTPLESMAQNVGIGEVTNLAEMRRIHALSAKVGLGDYADHLAAVIRDERSHIRIAFDILKHHAPTCVPAAELAVIDTYLNGVNEPSFVGSP